jgi:hypothetical protein
MNQLNTTTHKVKVRVIMDTEEDVFRDIEISSSARFFDLHRSILKSFHFEDGEMASFYMSDDEWEKGMEISLMDMGEGSLSMENVTLQEMLHEVGTKVLYLYDFMRMWIFYVEVMELSELEDNENYPRMVLAFGNAPSQDSKEWEGEMMMGGMDEDMEEGLSEEEEEDEFGGEERFDEDEWGGSYDYDK